jgi:chromosome segregation ATPase
MSLLESSPFLSSLLFSYAELAHGHHCGGSPAATLVAGKRASGPVSSTSHPSSYITEQANSQTSHSPLQAEIDILRNELTQAQESAALEIQRANRDAQHHLVEQARVNTELDSTKAAYAQLKENHEQTLHARKVLVDAFAKLQVEHAQAVSDKKEYCMEIEKLQEVQAEQTVNISIVLDDYSCR